MKRTRPARKSPRRRRSSVEIFARQTQRMLRTMIRDQTARVTAVSESFDAVRIGHADQHARIAGRLDAIDALLGRLSDTLDETRATLEVMRRGIEPLQGLMDRIRATHLRAAPPQAAPQDPETTTAARAAGA